jgi:peroxiredoxin 2/4
MFYWSIKNLKLKAMKIRIIIIVLLSFSVSQIWSQENNTNRIPLIGENAPAFTAASTNGLITFPDDFGSKWKILFSHPADYTPVCSSEILELAQMQQDFDEMNTKIAIISTDILEKHYSWKKSLESLNYKNRPPVKIEFPLIADNNWTVSKEYGMLHSPSSSTKDVRGVYIIDPANKIRAIFFYPMQVGRNMDEILRTVAALKTADKEEVLTPANWKPGDDVMMPYVRSADEAENLGTGQDLDKYKVSWYMLFKKLNTSTSMR